MPTVKLELESRPESLIMVRGLLTGVADCLGFDTELLHSLKTVVSEACNNVVLHAYEGPPGPFAVSLDVRAEGVEAVVRDWGRGIRHVAPSRDRIHLGLAVISTLADRAQFIRAPEGGTEVRMAFMGHPGNHLAEHGEDEELGEQVEVELSGDAIVTLSPAGLLGTVLGRVASGLAARACFSLDRSRDLYRLADAVCAHAEGSAIGGRVACAMAVRERGLELTVGPFHPGSGAVTRGYDGFDRFGSALSLLAVELAVEPVAEGEMWRLVMLDGDGASPAPRAGLRE